MKRDFLELSDKLDLANFLGITVKQLDFNLYNTEGRYNSFSIPKKSGGKRIILAPIPSLKTIQAKLEKEFSKHYKIKNHVHGFVSKKGIKSNAKIHIKQNHVLNLDLENFFPCINFGRIRGIFLKNPFNFNQEVASLLAQLCTQNNQLPQGSPCSPVLSNFICRRLDNELRKLAAGNKCYYSRYADDITISTNLKFFPGGIAKIIQEKIELSYPVLKIVKSNGFIVN
ncbi:reverse transcriptase domain-containing protein [Salinimicrobium sp. WS361]|uniref:reverse transcriptase domain-containing protein n=1 Tax=Salinimicrobium sp. WS361 TaxID=3425123 RepID=UPI003D6DF4DB